MPTKTFDAIYRRGVIRPLAKLPLKQPTRIRLTLTLPPSPVARTRGIIRVSPQTARAIIYGEETEFWG